MKHRLNCLPVVLVTALAACGDNTAPPLPPPVPALNAASDLAAKLTTTTTASLAWTDNAADETGFRIERKGAHEAAFSEIGAVAANVTSFSDPAVVGGASAYRVIALRGTEQAAPSNAASLMAPLAPQTATLTVNLNTLAVTVGQQPLDFTLAASAVDPNPPVLAPTSIALTLVPRNKSGRVVFNLKAVFTSIEDDAAGTPVAAGDLYDGHPFAHFGNAGMDLDASASKDVVISGIDPAAQTLTIELALVDSPLLLTTDDYSGGNLLAIDPSGVATSYYTELDLNGGEFEFRDATSPMQGVLSPDNRFAYYGLRNQPAVVTVDLLTLTPVLGPSLTADAIALDGTGAVGMVRAVTMSPDGAFLYATLMTNMHAYENSTSDYDGDGTGTIEVVKLNRSTLAEVGRAVLVTEVTAAQGREFSLSADGTRGALAIKVYDESYGEPTDAVHGRFFVVNTEDMSVVDGDPDSDLLSFNVLDVAAEVQSAAMSPDGTEVYLATTNGENSLSKVTLATGAIEPVLGHGLAGETYSNSLAFGPDGRLYWDTYYTGGNIYNPADGTWLQPLGSGVRATAFTTSGVQYALIDYSTSSLALYNLWSDELVPSPADGADVRYIYDVDVHATLLTSF